MNCLKCDNENLSDYPVCAGCAARAHFTNRPCRCDSCAVEIKVRAERRAGEMLEEGAENGDRRKTTGNNRKFESHDVTQIPPTLAEIGISKMQSSRWQALAVEDRPVILIAPANHGTFEVKLPFKHHAFLSEFKLKIGRSFRTWNEFRGSWEIKPLDAGHLDLVAQIIRQHFKGFDVMVEQEVG